MVTLFIISNLDIFTLNMTVTNACQNGEKWIIFDLWKLCLQKEEKCHNQNEAKIHTKSPKVARNLNKECQPPNLNAFTIHSNKPPKRVETEKKKRQTMRRHHSTSLVSHSQHVLKTICMIIRRRKTNENNNCCVSFERVCFEMKFIQDSARVCAFHTRSMVLWIQPASQPNEMK